MDESVKTVASMESIESPPCCADWCEQDECFFRIVAAALPAAFLCGASSLLASYDAD